MKLNKKKIIKNFFSTVISNLNHSKSVFIQNYKSTYSYKQAKSDIEKINHKLSFLKREKIAIFSDKSFNYYSAVLAVILSGNIWIQISPSIPLDRIKKILSISKTRFGIYDESFSNKKVLKFNKITFFNLKDVLNQKNKKEIQLPKILPDDLAMIFFTSGSTGVPKGVKISYLNFISCSKHQIQKLNYSKAKEVFSDYHDSSFVMSLVIIFPAVYLNCKISPLIEKRDKLLPIEHLLKNRITVLITVPSFLLYMKTMIEKNKLKLKNLILCGENFSYNLLRLILNNIKFSNIFNLYGSTETSPWAFYYKFKNKDLKIIQRLGQVPIGKPFSGIKTLINEKKELLITGSVISSGYLGNSKTDAQKKFITIKKRKYYNTGDIVQNLKGIFFCKGRNDSQIKLRGYRIDTSEIEVLVKKILGVNFAYCFLKNDKDHSYLVLIVMSDKVYKEEFIKKYLSSNVPIYMIPKNIIFVKNLKFNKNGKVDKIYYRNKF